VNVAAQMPETLKMWVYALVVGSIVHGLMRMKTMSRAQKVDLSALIDFIFKNPGCRFEDVANGLGCGTTRARKEVDKLEDMGTLFRQKRSQKTHLYTSGYAKLFNILPFISSQSSSLSRQKKHKAKQERLKRKVIINWPSRPLAQELYTSGLAR